MGWFHCSHVRCLLRPAAGSEQGCPHRPWVAQTPPPHPHPRAGKPTCASISFQARGSKGVARAWASVTGAAVIPPAKLMRLGRNFSLSRGKAWSSAGYSLYRRPFNGAWGRADDEGKEGCRTLSWSLGRLGGPPFAASPLDSPPTVPRRPRSSTPTGSGCTRGPHTPQRGTAPVPATGRMPRHPL